MNSKTYQAFLSILPTSGIIFTRASSYPSSGSHLHSCPTSNSTFRQSRPPIAPTTSDSKLALTQQIFLTCSVIQTEAREALSRGVGLILRLRPDRVFQQDFPVEDFYCSLVSGHINHTSILDQIRAVDQVRQVLESLREAGSYTNLLSSWFQVLPASTTPWLLMPSYDIREHWFLLCNA